MSALRAALSFCPRLATVANGSARCWGRRLPAPTWLDSRLGPRRRPLQLQLRRPTSRAQRQAQAQLDRACAKIAGAAHRLSGRDPARAVLFHRRPDRPGDLDYDEAFVALLAASRAMPAYGKPWHNLEERVAGSIKAGMERPLPLSDAELWMREFRARARLKLAGASHVEDNADPVPNGPAARVSASPSWRLSSA